MVNHTDVRLQFCRQVVLLPDAGDAFQIFSGTFSALTAQLITARARVRDQIEKRLFLLFERFDDQALNGVFKDVGVVACVEAVAITEHG